MSIIKRDLQVMSELDKDARISLTKIAKRVNLSKQAVSCRIDSLIKKDIIQMFYTIVNTSSLGYIPFYLFLTLRNLTIDKENEIRTYLKENQHVTTFNFCDGVYDLVIGLIAKDNSSLYKELTKFYSDFSLQIRSKRILNIVDVKSYPRDYLLEKKRSLIPLNRGFHNEIIKEVKLDKINLSILSLLTKNARLSSTEISRKLNISATSVIRRIKSMQKEKIINGYSIHLAEKFFPTHIVMLEFNHISSNIEKKILSYAANNNKITYIAKTFGECDFVLNIETRNFQEYRTLIIDIKSNFSKHLYGLIPLLILDTPKLNFYPIHQTKLTKLK
jgi:DNA-binding Lrp family transcriptional regulator